MSLKSSPIRRLEFTMKSSNSQVKNPLPQIQGFETEIHLKELEIKSLFEQNALIKLKCQEEIASYVQTIQILENQLKEIELMRRTQFQIVRDKYNALRSNQSQHVKSYYSYQVEFLLREIATMRIDCTAKDEQLIIKQRKITQIAESYERELQQKMLIIGNLNRSINMLQNTKNRQIKEISIQRQLERSRTSGVVQSSKQNNQFIDRQIRKLSEQILEKDIKLQNLLREINKNKRKSQEMEKLLIKKLDELRAERQVETKEREQHFGKIQKSLKQQIVQLKTRELQLLNEIDTTINIVEALKSQIKRHEDTIKSHQQQITGYKDTLEKQREEHAQQISNLMKERKKRISQPSSSRSIGTSSKDGSGIEQQQSKIREIEQVGLPTVKEEDHPQPILQKIVGKNLASSGRHSENEMEGSNITSDRAQEEQNQIAKIIIHYGMIIEELKKTHHSEIEFLEHKINNLSKSLDQKQQETLDILTKFSPLVKIHAKQKTIEEDRRERIQRHWKADLALLQIMLEKYKIQTYLT